MPFGRHQGPGVHARHVSERSETAARRERGGVIPLGFREEASVLTRRAAQAGCGFKPQASFERCAAACTLLVETRRPAGVATGAAAHGPALPGRSCILYDEHQFYINSCLIMISESVSTSPLMRTRRRRRTTVTTLLRRRGVLPIGRVPSLCGDLCGEGEKCWRAGATFSLRASQLQSRGRRENAHPRSQHKSGLKRARCCPSHTPRPAIGPRMPLSLIDQRLL